MKKFFLNKKVLITGATGFKGSWLSLWMYSLGAKVLGIADDFYTTPSNFKDLNLSKKINFKKIDIQNFRLLQKEIIKFQPDFIFHLAAQAIVKKSIENPRSAWSVNTLGTVNILESLKKINKNIIIVMITSDKVYKNLEVKRGYVETDILGGLDPYSASKAAADLAIQSYMRFILKKKKNIQLCIVRAGNVIGGGDWALGRIVPDCMRQWSSDKVLNIRNPNSTRHWQHVLDVLNGYMTLAIKLKKNRSLNAESFNFGPKKEKKREVINIVKEMNNIWKHGKWKIKKDKNFKESNLLQLNSRKAKSKLGWNCKLNLKETIQLTAQWYKKYYSNKKNIFQFSLSQIKTFESVKK